MVGTSRARENNMVRDASCFLCSASQPAVQHARASKTGSRGANRHCSHCSHPQINNPQINKQSKTDCRQINKDAEPPLSQIICFVTSLYLSGCVWVRTVVSCCNKNGWAASTTSADNTNKYVSSGVIIVIGGSGIVDISCSSAQAPSSSCPFFCASIGGISHKPLRKGTELQRKDVASVSGRGPRKLEPARENH